MLPPTSGIVGLALVSVALAMIAYAINVEALGVTAALGAFFAPVLLGQNRNNADLLLLYLASMAAGLGLVAARRRWRLATLVIAASYFGVGTVGAADHANPWGVLLFGLIGGTAGLYVGLRERWWETRLLTFSGGWTLLAAAGERIPQHWAVLARGLVLSRRSGGTGSAGRRSSRSTSGPQGEGTGWSAGEALYFFVTPVLLGWAVHGLDADRFDARPWLAPADRGGALSPRRLPAASAGVRGGRRGGAWASPRSSAGSGVSAGLGAARHSRCSGPRSTCVSAAPTGAGTGCSPWRAALQQLFDGAAGARRAADRAFVGPWALALWGSIAVTVAVRRAGSGGSRAAGRIPGSSARDSGSSPGAMALFGVTGELRRYFELRSLSAETAKLASGLAVSAWWLLFAAGARDARLPAVAAARARRRAGVAGLAVAKVIFFDLSSLDALYRVGSVFLLALVALSLAYLYYRHDRSAQT